MSNTIYTYAPYFYIIQHINSGKYYAGVKYAGNANPDKLLKPGGYQTSSSKIKQIIFEEGLDSFTIRKIRVFETAEQALEYESRFLRRVNASYNESFLNRSNGSLNSLNVDLKKSKQTCLERYGVEYTIKVPEFREKKKQTCLKKYGVEYAIQSSEVKNIIKQNNLKKYGVEYPLQSLEGQNKYKQTMLENFGVEYPIQSKEIKEKIKQTCLENFGVENPMQSDEVKEKIKQTNLEKYGCENVFQNEDIKDKSKQTMLEKYGYDHPNKSPEIKEKGILARHNLRNRPIILEIKKYKELFKLKFGSGWILKKQEILDGILAELKTTYGEISENI